MSCPIRLFCSDLDGTLVGNPEGTERFRRAWKAIEERHRPTLVYSSGRLADDGQELLAREPLPPADYLIGGVGTEILELSTGRILSSYGDQLADGWNRAVVEEVLREFPGVIRQPERYQAPYKSSWYLHRAHRETLELLRQLLHRRGLNVSVVYSSLRDLDVLPHRATKGGALRWLLQHLQVHPEEALVAGDSGNDSSMFLLAGIRGIVVDNAQPELFEAVLPLPVYCSVHPFADGVVEGLSHYGLLPERRVLRPSVAGITREAALQRLLDSEGPTVLSSEDRQLIADGYDQALATLRRNITPYGFSAACLEENEVFGTDENYRSVWARDGSMTIVCTAFLEDEEIRQAQRRTLETLLERMSPAGQVPSNVSIDTGRADYSGVGGICSIDSALWLIIAAYHYVRGTQDLAFLHRYGRRLQIAMNWLSAHDSNNDGLLEIPEASDWTDLFGRSYNVLYDEVLWFRASVCFGRLLELLGDGARAADYLHWSQHIQGQILSRFWPNTARTVRGFTEQQFGLGDVCYLLPEITPFGYNWRCDVLGNVLAFLYHVVDIGRARRTFQFLWGSGVNDPFPVACLYPPVQAGDPDWKPYYAVNLLNLPGHYHNGGIWPMVGGFWVRYIHRLGLHELACRELRKLAELNRQGMRCEWEFNEWAHGRTGRPMGKRFQAWSAASYVRACQELGMSPELLEDSD